jgi:hypothetical protein
LDPPVEGLVAVTCQLGRAVLEVGGDESIGIAGRGHAGRSCAVEGVRASASTLARIAAVAWCSRDSDCAERHADAFGDLGQRQAEVVMEDEDRSLLDRQPAEGAVQLVTDLDR